MSLAGETYPEDLGPWRIAISRHRPIKKHPPSNLFVNTDIRKYQVKDIEDIGF
jgi:hypothetical protein